jgi:SAM-dependent MidA family methyltransferase
MLLNFKRVEQKKTKTNKNTHHHSPQSSFFLNLELLLIIERMNKKRTKPNTPQVISFKVLSFIYKCYKIFKGFEQKKTKTNKKTQTPQVIFIQSSFLS